MCELAGPANPKEPNAHDRQPARQIGQVVRGELDVGVGVGEVLIEHRGKLGSGPVP